MKYFIFNNQRDGTCYHEFYKGKWDNHTFWKSDSIFLHDDLLQRGFYDTLIEVIPEYDRFGITEVSAAQWLIIGKNILEKDAKSQALYNEVNDWVQNTLQSNNCFTILGI